MAVRENFDHKLACTKCGATGSATTSEWSNPMHHGGSLGNAIESISEDFRWRADGIRDRFEHIPCKAPAEAV